MLDLITQYVIMSEESNETKGYTMTKLGLKLAKLNAKSNLEAWAAKPWHVESAQWVSFWSAKLVELNSAKVEG